MRRGIVAAAAAAVAVAGGSAAVLRPDGSGTAPPAAAPATTTVTRADLTDRAEEAGTLGHGDATEIAPRAEGTVTWLPAEGQVISRGQALLRVDTEPVVLIYGTMPPWRDLGPGDEGDDVRQLETTLKALGYKGFTADDEYTSATAAAVEDWQDDLGVRETGRVAAGAVAVAVGPVRVADRVAALGGAARPGAAAITVTGTAPVVTVDLPVADQRLAAKGAAVTVELPGGRTVPGTVADVGRVAELPAEDADPGADATIAVTVTLGGADTGGLDQAPVTVGFTAERRTGVLTVPVAALLSLAEGGHGLEIVDGGARRVVAVETGLFADGRVEVSGDGVAEGTVVGVAGT